MGIPKQLSSIKTLFPTCAKISTFPRELTSMLTEQLGMTSNAALWRSSICSTLNISYQWHRIMKSNVPIRYNHVLLKKKCIIWIQIAYYFVILWTVNPIFNFNDDDDKFYCCFYHMLCVKRLIMIIIVLIMHIYYWIKF